MINCKGDFKVVECVLKDKEKPRQFSHLAKFMAHFAWGAKISHTMRTNFAHCAKIN